MRSIGFSTGSLAFGDFLTALQMLKRSRASAVELSALREHEVAALSSAISDLDVTQFSYVSIHFPSRLSVLSEAEALDKFQGICEQRHWNLVVHPDVIQDFERWQALGSLLCIENMDIRKPIGRFADDMERLFQLLPDASFCFDVAHVRQVDPTMCEAQEMLVRFRDRLRQVHLSELNSGSGHERLSFAARVAMRRICHLVPPDVPIVLETPVGVDELNRELEVAESSFDCTQDHADYDFEVNCRQLAPWPDF